MHELAIWWRNPGAESGEVWTLVPDQDGDTTFHLAPFVESLEHPHCFVQGWMERSKLPTPGSIVLPHASRHDVTTEVDYCKVVDLAVESIEKTALKKVVLSRSEWWDHTDSPESVFAQKCQEYPNALVYLLSIPEAGVWLGATPELLLQKENNHYETVSLAGTRETNRDHWTSKEIREQALVTEFIEKQVKELSAKNILIGSPTDRAYGPFVHLESRIRFESLAQTKELLKALHPTPAVGGEPRSLALDFIAQHEKQSRGYYSGFFGWSAEGKSNYYVNLRCMQWFVEGARVFAGGGIVSGSVASEEWQETVLKLRSIRGTYRG
jgi:isochorismate synthase